MVRVFHRQRDVHAAVSSGRDPGPAPELLLAADRSLTRRAFLNDAVYARLGAKDGPGARAAVQRYLDTYPEEHQSGPRLSLVYEGVRIGAAEEVRTWVAAWRKAKKPFDVGQALGVLARHDGEQGQWERAVAGYEEAVRADPKGFQTPYNRLSLARAYGRTGNDAKMLALLKELAADPPAGVPPPRDTSAGVRLSARESLGDYYTDKRDWKEALKWWEAWRPSSGCGLGIEAEEKKKRERIEQCRRALGRP
jgi:tetratricopeptide (TPR) repeat protein